MQYKLKSIEAIGPTSVVQLSYRYYKDFANDTTRSADQLNMLFLTQILNFKQVS